MIPVIDLFAGPGGLGEGFSSIFKSGKRVFDIGLSIEMNPDAHRTLELRSFYRQFALGKAPSEYYRLLKEPNLTFKEEIRRKMFQKFSAQAEAAKREALCAELGSSKSPSSFIDRRIADALKGRKTWLLIGGPPCQAYSLIGRSRRQWKGNLDKADKRVHLYKEYLRIIAKHHPTVFVMENVKGILSAKIDGESIFDLIKEDLSNPSRAFPGRKSPKYRIYSLVTSPDHFDGNGSPVYGDVRDFVIRAEQYGIPQARHRVIILGVREDVKVKPGILKAFASVLSTRDVISDLPKLRSGISRSSTGRIGIGKRRYRAEADSDSNWLKLITKFSREIVSSNGFAKIKPPRLIVPQYGTGSEFIEFGPPSSRNPLFDWYHDSKLHGVCNHQSRAHLVQDLKRYCFAGFFTQKHKRFPRLEDFEKHGHELMPDHKNASTGKFSDRFRVQMSGQPATTVTSHISKDGHYYIHYDLRQCRSLTVREAARIQTFPDNYLFCGPRTAQFHQVGNAVPPLLAKQIAEIVLKCFKGK